MGSEMCIRDRAALPRSTLRNAMKNEKRLVPPNFLPPRLLSGLLLLLVDDDAPGVLLIAVHDVGHPALDLGRVGARVALAQGDVDVGVAVADLRDGADEELQDACQLP